MILLTRGSYAYDTIEASSSRIVLQSPVNNTIFFAGEYLYEGTAMGTVEAALTSGLQAAEKCLVLNNGDQKVIISVRPVF